MTKSSPRPGAPVRGSRRGRPIMALLDLVGRRWVLRILWELRDAGLTFRALQTACDGISPTVLNERLHELRDAKLVAAGDADGYELTLLGEDLVHEFVPLVAWSERWARSLAAAR